MNRLYTRVLFGLAAFFPSPAFAAPEVQNVAPRGLQAGGTTTLTIDGADLLPAPRLLLPIPIAAQTVHKDGTANRVRIDVTLGDDVPPGIYQLRVANAKGVSNAIAVGIDELPQVPFGPKLDRLPTALHGTVSGDASARTTLAGKKGQRIVVEVETRRLGTGLDPFLELSDARGVQVAWSQGLSALAGDARLEAILPADGSYTLNLRDALYRAPAGSLFRLKVGELRYAELLLPLALQRGAKGTVQLLGNVPADSRATLDLTSAFADTLLPLPRLPGVTAAPGVLVSDIPEVVEAEQPQGKVQEVSVPAGINGWISKAKEEDHYRLLVKPGMQLRFDVLADRAGSPLDGVLTIRNEAGNQLAVNDDRANTIDPGLDFTVPAGAKAVVVALKDLHGRGGPSFVYRIGITLAGQPTFSLALAEDRHHVPRSGTALVRVKATRAGYNGPIKLSLPGLPQGIAVAGDEIPAGVSDTLLSLSASPDADFAQVLTHVVGASTDPKTPLRRLALLPETSITRSFPWLRADLPVAVVEPVPLAVAWSESDANLPIGQSYPVKIHVTRAPGVAGPVRLSLVTSQVVPNLPAKPNQPNQPPQPDLNKAIRFPAPPVIPADQTAAAPSIGVPADLPALPYHLAIQAELLGADGKKVVATAVTPSRLLKAVKPVTPKVDVPKPLAIFEDQPEFVKNLTEGGGKATLEEGDKHSGKASVKVTPDQRFNAMLPGLGVKVRQNPGPGEYRYLRFAWKKKGGETICLQLAHDGQWGPVEGKPAKFRYHAGPGPECFGASLVVDKKLPDGWVVVTRDLFADFGEFTLTGLAFSPLDGEFALFDHIYLGRNTADFEAVKPK